MPSPHGCTLPFWAGSAGSLEEGITGTGLASQLLRLKTVKVYVNNEINILVLFFSEPTEVPHSFKMCFGLKNRFCEFGYELFVIVVRFSSDSLLVCFLFFSETFRN